MAVFKFNVTNFAKLIGVNFTYFIVSEIVATEKVATRVSELKDIQFVVEPGAIRFELNLWDCWENVKKITFLKDEKCV